MLALASLAQERKRDVVKLRCQAFGIGFFADAAALCRGLHLRNDRTISIGGLDGQLAGQQKIASIPLRDLYHVAAMAEIVYVFFQNDFHIMDSVIKLRWRRSPATSLRKRSLEPRCERQQSDIARLLDGGGETPLVRRADPGQAPRNDLAALGNE